MQILAALNPEKTIAMKSENLPFLYELCPTVQNYAWGNRNPAGIIARFLKHRGTPAEEGQPLAEVWMGAHPSSPSLVIKSFPEQETETSRLNVLIQKNPEHFLGRHLTQKGIFELPFLFKILDAGKALSIQTHPDKKTAERLHAEDPANYPDPNHKPELAVNAGGMRALIGFRPVQEIHYYLKKYSHLAELTGYPDQNASITDFMLFFERLMTAEPNKVKECTETHLRVLNSSKDSDAADSLFLGLLSQYEPADPGLYCVYFMNITEPAADEGYFLESGLLHAYLSGSIIECMAASDNVIRAGLTPKYRDTKTLLRILNRTSGLPEIIRSGTPAGGLHEFALPKTDFRLFKAGSGSAFTAGSEGLQGPAIILLLEGELHIQCCSQKMQFFPGSVLLIPGDLSQRNLTLHFITDSDSLCYIASAG